MLSALAWAMPSPRTAAALRCRGIRHPPIRAARDQLLVLRHLDVASKPATRAGRLSRRRDLSRLAIGKTAPPGRVDPPSTPSALLGMLIDQQASVDHTRQPPFQAAQRSASLGDLQG
jgi:hypothetical protein